MNRGRLKVETLALRIGTIHAVFISRLNLKEVLFDHLKTADPVITRTGFENISKCQSRKRRVTAGAATADNQTIDISIAASRKISRSVHAIIYVNHAPLAIQPLSISPAVTSTPTIVHIQNPKPAAGPVLNVELQRSGSSRRRPAVTDHYQRRPFRCFRLVVPIRRRIEKSIRSTSLFGWIVHLLRKG